MVPRDLGRLLRPRTVAVLGGREAEAVAAGLDRAGFTGTVWPINPRRKSLAGRPCVGSLDDLPTAPDAAFVGLNRHLTIEAVAKLASMGAGGAVCYASGFREAAGGQDLQRRLVEAAGPMPILGPNCYGFINYLDGALLWPDQHGGKRVERGVALVLQSSNIAINLTMQRRGLPVAYVVTAGNQAQTGLSDLAGAILDDRRVTALGLHIEGFDDVAALEGVLTKARACRTPVAVLKVGRSRGAQALALTHTASLAGADALADAFFARLGAARVRSLPALLETLKVLHVHGALPGNALCSLSCSGGEASLVADAAEGLDLAFRPFTAEETARLRTTLSDLVHVSNPLDYHTFVWGNGPRMAAVFAAALGCGFDLSLLVLDYPRTDRCEDAGWEPATAALIEAAAATGARTALVASLPENLPEERSERLLAGGVAPLVGIDEALLAAEAAARVGRVWAEPAPPPLAIDRTPLRPGPVLDEWDAKQRLRAAGLVIPEGRLAATPTEAAEAAEALGYPIVLKAVGSHLAHKTERGAVRLNLGNAVAVREAALAMQGLGTRFLVERMVEGALAELILGIARDPQFGLYLTVGFGGVAVEVLADAQPLLLPTDAGTVRRALLSLRSAPLLIGFRGRPAADLDAAVTAALDVAALALEEGGRLMELDVNPLMVLPAGQGAIAADALIRMNEPRDRQPTSG